MLKYRLLFGPIMIAGLLGLFWLDSRLDQVSLTGFWKTLFLDRAYLPAGLVMLALFLAVIPLGTIELCAIFRAKGIAAHPVVVAISGMAGCSIIYVIPWTSDAQMAMAILATLVICVFLAALVQHAWHQRTEGAVAAGGAAVFALIYMGFFPGFFILMRRWHSAWLVLGVILAIKACDIGAYFTGRAIGRHKLIPWLSPKKTWEGLIGGVIASALVAVGLVMVTQHLQQNYDWQVLGHFTKVSGQRVWVPSTYPLWAVALVGLLFGLVGQFGDLTASLFKRDAGIKDSASYIPGFGGVLDVVDSPLGVAPLAYWAVIILDRISQ